MGDVKEQKVLNFLNQLKTLKYDKNHANTVISALDLHKDRF